MKKGNTLILNFPVCSIGVESFHVDLLLNFHEKGKAELRLLPQIIFFSFWFHSE